MDNYIQLKGFGFKFNQEACEIFFRRIELENVTSAGEVYACFFAGLFINAKMKGSIPEQFASKTDKDVVYLDFEKVCDWVDTLTIEEKKEVMDFMGETVKYKETLDKIQGLVRQATEENKKKEPEQTSNLTGSEFISSSPVS